MSRIRPIHLACAILVVAVTSLAVAACGGGSTTADTSNVQPQPASSGYASSPTASTTVSVGTSVHVTNTPTKAFRVRPVDTTESVAVGPAGYPVYTFQGETTQHIICEKTASANWPPASHPASRLRLRIPFRPVDSFSAGSSMSDLPPAQTHPIQAPMCRSPG